MNFRRPLGSPMEAHAGPAGPHGYTDQFSKLQVIAMHSLGNSAGVVLTEFLRSMRTLWTSCSHGMRGERELSSRNGPRFLRLRVEAPRIAWVRICLPENPPLTSCVISEGISFISPVGFVFARPTILTFDK